MNVLGSLEGQRLRKKEFGERAFKVFDLKKNKNLSKDEKNNLKCAFIIEHLEGWPYCSLLNKFVKVNNDVCIEQNCKINRKRGNKK